MSVTYASLDTRTEKLTPRAVCLHVLPCSQRCCRVLLLFMAPSAWDFPRMCL